MHEKCFKIIFFANFRKLQKKLPICKKKYTKILNSVHAVVTDDLIRRKKGQIKKHNFFWFRKSRARMYEFVPKKKKGETKSY